MPDHPVPGVAEAEAALAEGDIPTLVAAAKCAAAFPALLAAYRKAITERDKAREERDHAVELADRAESYRRDRTDEDA